MCRESLKEYLISESQIDKFKIFDLFEEEKTKQFSEKEKERLLELLESAKVIDPAVGSGAFPVGMMHEVVRLRKLLDPKLAKIKNDYNLKKEIIQNNLYGIDIEPEAIEICRLRHWLTLVVDEEAAIDEVEPLPNLDYKFVRGNSLIDTLKGYDILKLFKEGKLEKVVAIKEKIPSQQMALFNVLKDLEERIAQKQKVLKKGFSLLHNERKKLEVELYDLHFQYKKLKPKEIKEPVTQEALFGYKESFLEEYHKLRQGFFSIRNPEEKEKQRKVLENYEKIIFGNAKDYIISNLKAQIREIDNKNKGKIYSEISKRDKTRREKFTNEIFEIEEIFKKYEKEGMKPFFLPQWEFKEIYDDSDKGGFNIVIANPPYVSTKKVSKIDYRDQLKIKYGFIDDLYVHFIFRAFNFAKDNHGIVCFITSDTYFTITTKQRMRELLQSKRLIKLIPTPKAFEATVNTAIFIAKDEEVENYSFTFIDARELEFAKTQEEKLQVFENLKETRQYSTKRVAKFGREEYNIWLNPDDPLWQYDVDIRLFKNCIKKSFFTPNTLNIEIYNKYMDKIVELYKEWFKKIYDADSFKKNLKLINAFHNDIQEEDIGLLGTLTLIGTGIDTGGNNGKAFAVIQGTEEARRVKSRLDRLKKLGKDYKKMRGVIYQQINKDEVEFYDRVRLEEKLDGFDKQDSVWVPAIKGGSEENLYYAPIDTAINWNKKFVRFLINAKAPLRNREYYFDDLIYCSVLVFRFWKVSKSICINVTGSCFLKNYCTKIDLNTLLAYLNSSVVSYISKNFIAPIGSTPNDIKIIPVVIPQKQDIKILGSLVGKAISIQKQRFSIKNEKQRSYLWHKLQEIQSQIDSKVAEIYGIDMGLKGEK